MDWMAGYTSFQKVVGIVGPSWGQILTCISCKTMTRSFESNKKRIIYKMTIFVIKVHALNSLGSSKKED